MAQSEHVRDQAQHLILEVIQDCLSSEPAPSLHAQWTERISATGVAKLHERFPSLKFILTSTLLERTKGGLDMASAAHWDPSCDFVFNIRFENKHVICIVSITVIGCITPINQS